MPSQTIPTYLHKPSVELHSSKNSNVCQLRAPQTKTRSKPRSNMKPMNPMSQLLHSSTVKQEHLVWNIRWQQHTHYEL